MEKQFLVLIDTDKIKEYIFATNKLKEIRGASIILDELNLRETELVAGKNNGKKIYVGGGTGKFWFSEESDAVKFCDEIEKLYYDKTLTATITSWIEEKSSSETFKDALERGERQLRRKKADKRFSTQLETNQYIKFCELCGKFPVTELRKVLEETKWVCRSCFLKNSASNNKSKIYQKFEEVVNKELNIT